MRIIAGKAGGIQLKSLKGRDVRPTLDRVKESLFNIIAYYIDGAEVLDLFAGFGSLGIEALSRGAKHADFVESERRHLKIIEENLEKSNLNKNASVYQNDVFDFLEGCQKRYNLIFMDPPYKRDFTEETINLIIENNLLKEKGLIISERDSSEETFEFEELNIIKNREYGNTVITIYQLNNDRK